MDGYRQDSFDPNAGERAVTPSKGRWKIIVGSLAYFGLLFWLKELTGFPDSFGVHETCTGKGCIFDDWYYSYVFMERHRPLDVVTFLYMWAPLAALIAWFLLPRFRRANFSIYRKDNERPAPVGVSTPSIFDAEEADERRRRILIAVASSLALGALLIAILYFKGA